MTEARYRTETGPIANYCRIRPVDLSAEIRADAHAHSRDEVWRDHGPNGFSVWMAGGGVKRGYVHGATDDIGFKAEQDKVSVHDLHATVLHLLGMNHRDLVYERQGLQERLTDQFPARVVSEVLA